jgi:hypothetical protein
MSLIIYCIPFFLSWIIFENSKYVYIGYPSSFFYSYLEMESRNFFMDWLLLALNSNHLFRGKLIESGPTWSAECTPHYPTIIGLQFSTVVFSSFPVTRMSSCPLLFYHQKGSCMRRRGLSHHSFIVLRFSVSLALSIINDPMIDTNTILWVVFIDVCMFFLCFTHHSLQHK